MKKILALLLVFVMVFGLVACSGEKKTDSTTTTGAGSTDIPGVNMPTAENPWKLELTVWAPQEDQSEENPWLKTMTDKFDAAHPEFDITWTYGVCSEADAKGKVIGDPQAAAHVFLYANDQMEDLLNANALAKISGNILEEVKKECSAGMLQGVTAADGNVYGVPYSANTWFMYYDKSAFTEDEIKSFDAMLAKAPVSFPLNNGWYMPGFYVANGGTIYGTNGTDSKDGFKLGGANGTAVTEYLVDLVAHPNFVNDADGSGCADFRSGKVKAYFSGDWEYADNKAALGDNLGCAVLPSVNIGGSAKQLKAFNGSKAVGVNAYCDEKEILAAYMFAAFIGGAEGQKARYEARGTIPCANSLSDLVKDNPAAQAVVAVVNGASFTQPSLPQTFWDGCSAMANEILKGEVIKDNAAEKTETFNKSLSGEK